eukprot:scaffold1277_cov253-Pinguiococcus_pyrenoidosus.AAC.41
MPRDPFQPAAQGSRLPGQTWLAHLARLAAPRRVDRAHCSHCPAEVPGQASRKRQPRRQRSPRVRPWPPFLGSPWASAHWRLTASFQLGRERETFPSPNEGTARASSR